MNPIFSKKVQGQKHPGRWGIVEHQITDIWIMVLREKERESSELDMTLKTAQNTPDALFDIVVYYGALLNINFINANRYLVLTHRGIKPKFVFALYRVFSSVRKKRKLTVRRQYSFNFIWWIKRADVPWIFITYISKVWVKMIGNGIIYNIKFHGTRGGWFLRLQLRCQSANKWQLIGFFERLMKRGSFLT